MEKEFIELVNNNRALIFKVCNFYCHNQESRRDLFQEVVLQLWRSYPGFRKDAANSTWIYRVAFNTAISNFRKESKTLQRQLLTSEELEIPDMTNLANEKENRNILNLAIDKLTEIEKAIILLYLDEKTYEEISEIVGITNNNVGVRINRIKNKLSKLINTGL